MRVGDVELILWELILWHQIDIIGLLQFHNITVVYCRLDLKKQRKVALLGCSYNKLDLKKQRKGTLVWCSYNKLELKTKDVITKV